MIPTSTVATGGLCLLWDYKGNLELVLVVDVGSRSLFKLNLGMGRSFRKLRYIFVKSTMKCKAKPMGVFVQEGLPDSWK